MLMSATPKCDTSPLHVRLARRGPISPICQAPLTCCLSPRASMCLQGLSTSRQQTHDRHIPAAPRVRGIDVHFDGLNDQRIQGRQHLGVGTSTLRIIQRFCSFLSPLVRLGNLELLISSFCAQPKNGLKVGSNFLFKRSHLCTRAPESNSQKE